MLCTVPLTNGWLRPRVALMPAAVHKTQQCVCQDRERALFSLCSQVAIYGHLHMYIAATHTRQHFTLQPVRDNLTRLFLPPTFFQSDCTTDLKTPKANYTTF